MKVSGICSGLRYYTVGHWVFGCNGGIGVAADPVISEITCELTGCVI